MKKKSKCIVIALLLSGMVAKGQEGEFNKSIRRLTVQIQNEAVLEKEALKVKVDSINVLVDNRKLTENEAERLKNQFSQESSNRLELRINQLNDSLAAVVQSSVNHALESGDLLEFNEAEGETEREHVLLAEGADDNQQKGGNRLVGERRTTFRLGLVYGMSNVATEGAFANSDIRYIPSNFAQSGFYLKTRVFKNRNWLYLRYGVAAEHSSLKPTMHRYFRLENGETVLAEHEKDLGKSRLQVLSTHIPLYVEFDFTPKKVDEKTGKTYFRSEGSWRVGIGGYVNLLNKNSKGHQIYHYTEEGVKYRIERKEDLGINKTRYGLGAYIGYRSWSIFAQYELTPLFKNNTIKQNMWSLGLRLDL